VITLLVTINCFSFFVIFVESIQKFKSLKKSAHLLLMTSLEKAIWNWMDTYPHEFADLQVFNTEHLHSIISYCTAMLMRVGCQ